MNKVILTGNLVRSPELKQTTSGTSVLTNVIAVKRDVKDDNGEYQTDFIDFTAWGKQAEYVAQYGHKGDRVELCGRWQQRKWQTKNGENRTANECQVEQIAVFSRRQDDGKTPEDEPHEKQENVTFAPLIIDGDLPF